MTNTKPGNRGPRTPAIRWVIAALIVAVATGWFWSTTLNATPAWDDPGPITSDAELVALAHATCPAALDKGSCSDYSVVLVKDLPDAGQVPINWQASSEAAGMATPNISEVRLNPALAGQGGVASQWVIAHEWNHVEQALLAETQRGRDAMKQRAFDLFQPRTTPEFQPDDALELLADCMTAGDGAPEPPDRGYYLARLAPGEPTEKTCRGWEEALHGE